VVTWVRRGVVVGGLTGGAGAVWGADVPEEPAGAGAGFVVVVLAGFWPAGVVVAGVDAWPGNDRLT
jgi:hypothetical protein